MKKQTLVLRNNGENCGTYSVICFLESFKGNMDETCMRCLSFDDNRQVETPLYSTFNLMIPEWMTESFFLANSINYKFAVGLVGQFLFTLNEEL